MTRDEAMKSLTSDETEVRLRGARFFSREAIADDVSHIKAALKRETVPWIKRALSAAIARAEQTPSAKQITEASGADDLNGLAAQQIYAKAAEEVADSLIHELAPVIGLLRVVLPRELNGAYAASQSRRYLDQLHSLMTAIRDLKRANALPTYTDFALGELIAEIIEAVPNPAGAVIQTVGPGRLIVWADKDQLRLAVSNGLRNALEAVHHFSIISPPTIVITWGATANDNFVVIKDTGPGFNGDPAAALKLGATSKKGHVGFGLALAQQAMLSMQGDIALKNDEDGAHFEIRWFKDNEDTVR